MKTEKKRERVKRTKVALFSNFSTILHMYKEHKNKFTLQSFIIPGGVGKKKSCRNKNFDWSDSDGAHLPKWDNSKRCSVSKHSVKFN